MALAHYLLGSLLASLALLRLLRNGKRKEVSQTWGRRGRQDRNQFPSAKQYLGCLGPQWR